ncbi:MAG: DUF2231 domain-containing protein [Methylococcaceae bacterium]
MNNLLFQIHGNADHDGIADGLAHLLGFIEGLVAQGDSGGGFFAALLPGIAALENIHPLLVHFPIAFLLFFFLIDVLGTLTKKLQWRELASYLLYIGTISAVFTVLAGFSAANSVPHGDNVHEIMEDHEHIGVSILILASSLSVWRYFTKQLIADIKNTAFLILAAVLCLLITFGADLGGLMVYHYGVAVQAVPVPEGGYSHHHHAD